MTKAKRKPLFVRIVQRVWRDLVLLVSYAYLRLYAVPVLKTKGVLAPGFTLARGHGSFLLLSERGFVKLAISPVAALDRVYANYERLRGTRPDLADALPAYQPVQAVGLAALACEALGKIPYTEALAPAAEMYKRFHNNSLAGERLTLADCPQIGAGLREIEAKFGIETARALQASTEAFLARGHYSTGLAHGDFHSRNVMRNEAGDCTIIDLDCVRLKGVAEFDALYFSLEQEWSRTGRPWTWILAECFTSQGRNISTSMSAFSADWSSEFGIAFFLDRVGQDFANSGARYEHRDLAVVIDAARNEVE